MSPELKAKLLERGPRGGLFFKEGAEVVALIEGLETDAKDKALIKAVYNWWTDRHPKDPGDAELMKALWRHRGDLKEPCPECNGECGCAPITADAACGALDKFSEEWRKKKSEDER